MILVDTSVLVDYERAKGADAKLNRLFATLPVFVPGVVRAELLAGARTPAERADTIRMLASFGQFDTEEAVWDPLGDHLRMLRRAGLNVPFPDILLATIAIDAGLELWTRDNHFTLMQAVLPALRLFTEPP